MLPHFDLIITTHNANRSAEFSLCDANGQQLAYRRTEFARFTESQQRGLFDLRNYLHFYVEEQNELAAVAEVGVLIAEHVLGEEIFSKLWGSRSQRTLRIQLPGAGDAENDLAALLVRVPWEIARPTAGDQTLSERNLLVRIVHDRHAPTSTPIALANNEPLRVLFVFAEARGSHPLGARKERRELQRLFDQEIYPKRKVVAHFLTHGVTRERLSAQIQENNGYHIVHWSGHGHMNLLELCKPGGESDHLSGEELLSLFADAGGFLPRFVFLSACHSGDFLAVKDWDDFLAVARGKEPGAKLTDTRDLNLPKRPGYTGTAHALLEGGVPSVVAMRYAVGDDYAREMAVEFYRAVLAHAAPKTVAAGLTMARQAMLDGTKHDPARLAVCDHATPVLYGEEHPGLTLSAGISPEHNPPNPRLHRIAELTTADHQHFVGRTWELVGLGAEFIGSRAGAEVKPVAVITGLGGMGKTALTAEALALWERRFTWVLLYQAKPNRLEFEHTLRDIHMKLMEEGKTYHNHVQENPGDAIFRAADPGLGFTGPNRQQRLMRNLVRALKDEPILIVLDNFETNLKPVDPATPSAACQDTAWDECLGLLAKELVGSSSRVLITSRRPLAALTGDLAHCVVLGPLPPTEAALYIVEEPTLSRMVFGADRAERMLAQRLLNASRFHPLLMDRLAKLAALKPPRKQLMAALDILENRKTFKELPALFATKPGDANELAYLDDALAASLDQLIRDLTPDARRLLWIIALANQPEELWLVRSVWGRESFEHEQLRQIKQLLDRLPLLPPETQEHLKTMPPDLRAKVDTLPEAPARPDPLPLLDRLVSFGLVTEQRNSPGEDNPSLMCHELVRDRILAWMQQTPADRAELSETAIRLGYAERLISVFKGRMHQDMSAALAAGSRALVYCVQAEVWDRLGGFASALITSTGDPRLLEALLPHLQTAAEQAPQGRPRWVCLGNLATALQNSGRPDLSLPVYEETVAMARAVAQAGGEGSKQAWSDLSVTTAHSAHALRSTGNLDAARHRWIENAEAAMQAGSAAIHIITAELEALRIDIMQGKVAEALPEVDTRVKQVEAWWKQHCAGVAVPEAPDAEFLARTMIAALDIALDAYRAQMDWPASLSRIEAILGIERTLNRPTQDIAATRMNRANVLVEMPDRVNEARYELEECLILFENNPDTKSKVLSSLANLFYTQGDFAQSVTQERRALALRVLLPNPTDRAVSHGNLAIYLQRDGDVSALAEAASHRIAALVYQLVARLGQHLKLSFHNHVFDYRLARDAGTVLANPRVADLLAQPAFAPLEQWLRERNVDLIELQADVDHFLDQARQVAEAE